MLLWALLLLAPINAQADDAAAYTIVEINSNHDEQNTGCYHSQHNGEEVVVTGYVSAVAYNGFYMQSAPQGVPYGGMWVYTGTDSAWLTGLAVGGQVEVRARVEEYYDLTELLVDPDDAAHYVQPAAGSSATMVPLEVTTGDVGTGCTAAGEAYEGLLVVVRGVTLLSEPNSYGEIEMDDGSGATQLEDGMLDTDTHLESVLGVGSLTGQTVESITGVVRFAFGSFEIHPRSEADIEVAGGGGGGGGGGGFDVAAALGMLQ